MTDFVWGVATSAYQIEGAVTAGGRGRSTWDTFSATPGKTRSGETGAQACDHYHRYPEDVALMRELGVDSYRFSVAWPRIQPDGRTLNRAGLGFYDRLIDTLCAAGIAPMATLYHWDTPQAVEDEGGWLNRDTAARFADYAAVLAEAFADRVAMWVPLNEPAMITLLGYGLGQHAPGQALLFDALPTAHHQLLAHGLAVRALRAGGAGLIGTANNHTPVWAADDRPETLAAAAAYDALHNRLFADPILLGTSPAHLPGFEIPAEDLRIISEPIDFYGVNYYNPTRIGAPAEGNPLPFELGEIAEHPATLMGSPIVPDGLRELLVQLRESYGEALPPVYITENGASFAEDLIDGQVHDQPRIDFLSAHLDSLRAAIGAGVDVRGYYVWSLLDNFEWAEGYGQPFGLVHVDFATQRRTPKDSFHWLREHIAKQRG
ncbi:GH1 family beta-glucosidase [Crossiella sp. CA-258035]|uniref:GH1 family beta-glucosidase n=1 Tax=Crossiella sp. CA-258035 TaxID=2981138 RepID=UPI0024BD1957|nr:GH1 family beta-glucosidase [Crossiella sp. CA-258035]WHT19552.1 GH1 family beta-glucosidase [Crossiella sp. CA-258035]